jgi:hypothetical protein
MAATPPINPPIAPAQIFPEEPILHYKNDAKEQEEEMTVGAGNRGLELDPKSAKDVQNLMRVLDAHYLTMSPAQKHHLQHGLPEVKIDNIINTERTNKFSPKSWMRKAVLGKMSTMELQVLKNNYALMRRYHQIAPAGVETAAERVRRAADERAFEQAGAALDAQCRKHTSISATSQRTRRINTRLLWREKSGPQGTTTGTG